MATDSPLIGHTIRFTDEQWERVAKAASERERAGIVNKDTRSTRWTPSDVVRQCACEVLGIPQD